MWDLGLETAEVVGSPDVTYAVAVSESAPTAQVGRSGEVAQRVTLLLPDAKRLTPPMRLRVRGLDLRVRATQMPPWPGEPALVTCELVNPDLPDEAVVFTIAKGFNPEDNTVARAETSLWTGAVAIDASDPRLAVTAGELAPVGRATINTDMPASVDLNDAWLRILASPTPALVGTTYKLVGETSDSSTSMRRVIGEWKAVL